MWKGYACILMVLNSDQVKPKYYMHIHYVRSMNKHQVASELDHNGELRQQASVCYHIISK
jgi:hypothetical protein